MALVWNDAMVSKGSCAGRESKHTGGTVTWVLGGLVLAPAEVRAIAERSTERNAIMDQTPRYSGCTRENRTYCRL